MSPFSALKQFFSPQFTGTTPVDDPFVEIDVDGVKKALKLEERGKERGGLCRVEDIDAGFDVVEHEIINLVGQELNRSQISARTQSQAYEGRLSELRLLHEVSTIRAESVKALGDFDSLVIDWRNMLTPRRDAIRASYEDLHRFRMQNGLQRPALMKPPAVVTFGGLAFSGLVEVLGNAFFLKVNDDLGYLGGLIGAIVVALLNVGTAAIVGWLVWPLISLRNTTKKIGASVAIGLWFVFVLVWNLFAAHFRDAKASGAPDAQSLAAHKLRSDQAGDNCYYLGLIYTLTSLAYAIFTFDPNDTATTIVQGFGIALASTILGLVLRVFFNQSRVDLYETEDSARLELAEASQRLKGQLSLISLEFKSFSEGLRQSVSEVRDEAIESVKTTSLQAVEAIQGLATEVRSTLETQATELTAHGKQVSKNTATVAGALGRHSAAIDKLSDTYDGISDGIRDMAEAAESLAKHSSDLAAQTEAARAQQAEALVTTSKLGQSADQILLRLNASSEKVEKWEAGFSNRLLELENGPKQSADMALKAIARAADAVGEAMMQLSLAQEKAIGSVANSTDGLLTVIKGHNASLEGELDKSREQVSKVHAALVDMTTKLANSIGSEDREPA